MAAPPLKGVPVTPLTGVLDIRSGPDQVPNDGLRLRQNFKTTAQGKIRRGTGYTKLLTNGSYNNEDLHDQLLTFIPDGIRQPNTRLFETESTRGVRSLIAARQSSISKLNEYSGNWHVLGSGYGGDPSTSAAAPRFKIAQVGDYLVFTNDFDAPMFHLLDSSPADGAPLLQTFPDLKLIGLTRAGVVWSWHDCLFLADVEMDGERVGYRLLWSNFNDPTSFDPAKIDSITGSKDLFTNERILAFAQFGTSGFIYTSAGIWEVIVVGGEQTFDFARRYSGEQAKGAVVLKYPETLVETPQAHYYLAEDGVYQYSPFYGPPRRAEWLHRGTGSSSGLPLALLDNIDTDNCLVHQAIYSQNELFITTASRNAVNNCPDRMLRVNLDYNVADVMDVGFTALCNYRSYRTPTVRDFIIENGICDLATLITKGYGFDNEGLPRPLPTMTSPFTPTHIYTSTAKVIGTSETPGPTKNVVSYARTGGVATFVVTAHGLATNNRVLIGGIPDSTFNGTFTVTVVNANTFMAISIGPNVTTTVPAATVRKIRKPHAAIAIVETDGTVTVKLTAHGLSNGDLLRVTPSLQGNPTLGGNLAPVTVLDVNTFTYPASALANDTKFGMPNVKNEVGGQTYSPNTGASGLVTTFAGTAGAAGSTDATGAAARFNSPGGTCVDLSGNIYVADTANHVIRKITTLGVVTTLAGTAGSSGSTDDTGALARFNQPKGIAVGVDGTLYVADTGNHVIRKVTAGGVVTTLAGTAGASGTTDGTGAAARFNLPNGIAIDTDGIIYIADTSNNLIRKMSGITVAGVNIGTAGSGYVAGDTLSAVGGTGTAATFTVSTVDGSGAITGISVATPGSYTVAPGSPNSASGGSGTGASLTLTFGSGFGNSVTTFATQSSGFPPGHLPNIYRTLNAPAGIVVAPDGTIYATDTGNHTVLSVDKFGVAVLFAGVNGIPGFTNGAGSASKFSSPAGLEVNSASDLFVADTNNSTIRKITKSAVVSTEAGLALTAGSVDGTGTVARFNHPFGIATDTSGNQYVADSANHTIRKVASGASQFQVTTLIPGRIYHYVPGANDASLTLQGTSTVITTDTFFTYDGLGALLLGPTSTSEKPVTAVISGGVPIVVKTIGPVLTPTSVSRADLDNPNVATITLAAHGFSLGDRLWIYGFSEQSLDFYDVAVSRISDDVDITANTFGIVAPGSVMQARAPTTATMAKLTTHDVTTEDWTAATADSDSLCALLGGERLDSFCLKCPSSVLLVGAHSVDLCLKQLADVFYRERCTNPTAVGISEANGYSSAVGTYLLDGYDSILRFAPMFTADDEKGMIQLDVVHLRYLARLASKIGLRIGIAAQPADPNTDLCGLVWFQHSLKDLKCLTVQDADTLRAGGQIPSKQTEWNLMRKGRVLCIELKVSGTGGDADFSAIVVYVKRVAAKIF